LVAIWIIDAAGGRCCGGSGVCGGCVSEEAGAVSGPWSAIAGGLA
jgi:hypothetical protein